MDQLEKYITCRETYHCVGNTNGVLQNPNCTHSEAIPLKLKQGQMQRKAEKCSALPAWQQLFALALLGTCHPPASSFFAGISS